MAEAVLGAVASGITVGALAAQITSSAIKLKLYWDQVKDAPRDVQDLIEQIEIIRALLVAVEDNQRPNGVSDPFLEAPYMLSSLQLCKRELAQLEAFTAEDAACLAGRISGKGE